MILCLLFSIQKQISLSDVECHQDGRRFHSWHTYFYLKETQMIVTAFNVRSTCGWWILIR